MNTSTMNNMITTATYDLVDPADHQTTIQLMPNLLNKLRLFYQAQNDDNIYHVVTCQDFPQGLENPVSLNDNYDYEFFFQSPNISAAISHVTCKLLSYSSIINLLNKKVYGMDFDVNNLKCRYLLTLHQKFNLEQSLKQILPSYF